MAMTPLPTGVGGTLFAPGGGMGGTGVPQSGVAPGGIKALGGGKNSTIQNLDSPHSGLRSTLSKGDPMSRLMGQYGKGHSFSSLAGGSQPAAGTLHSIRGGTGQMRRIRGGLGPGKEGQPGPSNSDYSMTSPDTE